MDSKIQYSSTLQPQSRRNLRRSSSLEEDSEEVQKKLEELRRGAAPSTTEDIEPKYNLSETAPHAYYFYQKKVDRSATTRHDHYPQTQPAGFAGTNYFSGSSNSLLSPEREKKISANLDNGIVQCSLCYNDYSEDNPKLIPRNLSCGHTYCTSCLQKLLLQSDSQTSVITCPNHCHELTRVKSYNVSNIAKNYPLLSILREIPLDRGANTAKMTKQQQMPPKCPDHDDYLRSYCMTDGCLVCSSCELYGSHQGHGTLFVSDAAAEERKKLKALRPDVLVQKEKMDEALEMVESTCRSTQKAGGKMEDQVDEFFGHIIALIEEKKADVKTDVRLRTQLRVNTLLEQAKDLRERAAQASLVYQKSGELIFANDYVVLSEAKFTLERIEGIFVNPPLTTPKARDDLKCSFKEDVQNEVCASLDRAATVVPDIATIDSSQITVEAFYDGFRISWAQQNFVDNQAISYHLQMAKGEEDYVNTYRGSTSKFTLKKELEGGVLYRFRVQVRTTEGVGVWSEPKVATRAEPGMYWHKKWRSVRVDLSFHDLEASRLGGSNHWGTFAADKLLEEFKQYYVEIEVLSLGKNRPRDKLVIGLISCSSKSIANVIDWQNGRKPIGEWDTPTLGFFPISGVFKSNKCGEVAYGQDLKIQVGDQIGVLLDMGQKKLSFFCNGSDQGVAEDNLQGKSYLLAVSIRDKIKVRLRFPPPPYANRTIRLIQLKSSQLAN